MQAFRTSGSFSFAHTLSREAASFISPLIVIAIGVSDTLSSSRDGREHPGHVGRQIVRDLRTGRRVDTRQRPGQILLEPELHRTSDLDALGLRRARAMHGFGQVPNGISAE